MGVEVDSNGHRLPTQEELDRAGQGWRPGDHVVTCTPQCKMVLAVVLVVGTILVIVIPSVAVGKALEDDDYY